MFHMSSVRLLGVVPCEFLCTFLQPRLFTLFTLAIDLSALIVLVFHGLNFLGFFSDLLKAWTYEY